MSNHLESAPSWLTKEYLEQNLRHCTNDETLVVQSVNISPGSSFGDNYLGQILRINLTLFKNNKESALSLIAKLKPETQAVKKIDEVSSTNFHEVESNFFSKTLNELNKRAMGRQFAPNFYLVDEKKSVIFMEDLKEKDFVMIGRTDFLRLDECLKAVEALATQHASSYLLIQDQPEQKEYYQKRIWQKELDLCKNFTHNALKCIQESIKKWQLTPSQEFKVLSAVDMVWKSGMEIAEPRPGSFLVLAHGDAWKSNMLFRYENNCAKEVRLLDFQIANQNSFAIDLQHVIFTSADISVILNNIDELLLRYHRIFDNIAPDVITLPRVKNEFEQWYNYGFLMSLIFRPYITVENPVDINVIISGVKYDQGCGVDSYIKDIRQIIQFLEKRKVI